jgi:hypothetical protein
MIMLSSFFILFNGWYPTFPNGDAKIKRVFQNSKKKKKFASFYRKTPGAAGKG